MSVTLTPGTAAWAAAPGTRRAVAQAIARRSLRRAVIREIDGSAPENLSVAGRRHPSTPPAYPGWMATISFARGAPSLDIVDVEGLSQPAAQAFGSDPAGTTAYGTSVGYVPLREWIAEQHGVETDQVLVTNGSMQADAFLFQLLVGEGDPVVVESPTYDRTLLNLRNRGADVHMIKLETDGISVDDLEATLKSGVRPTLAHIIPNFQNP